MPQTALSMPHWAITIKGMSKEMGSAIRAARLNKGLRVQDLADQIGKASSFVSRVETGEMKEMVTPEDLNAIARVLSLDVGDLLQRAGYAIRPVDNDALEGIPPFLRSSFWRTGEMLPDGQRKVAEVVAAYHAEDQMLREQMRRDRERRHEEGIDD